MASNAPQRLGKQQRDARPVLAAGDARPARLERTRRAMAAAAWALLALTPEAALRAQRYAWVDEGFQYRRAVRAPSTPHLSIIVAEFRAHGQIERPADQPAVYLRDQRLPSRLLQLGPGDFCRVAFQAQPGASLYHIYYGGRSANGPPPAWTARDGLLLETRRWRPCDLNRLDSLREAFAQAPPLGATYVPAVHHRYNPCDPRPQPFLSRYAGVLHAPLTGRYVFYTSSQDCSFLLLDGRVVAAAPGRHGPTGRGRFRAEVRLTEGPHPFEYWHAATGRATCMAAYWQIPGARRPAPLDPSLFRADRVGRARPEPPESRDGQRLPDFTLAALGDAPLPDDPEPLVRVELAEAAGGAGPSRGRIRWQFGDGLESEQRRPTHIYLRPDTYAVTLISAAGDATTRITQRVLVYPPLVLAKEASERLDQLADYLPVLETYDAAALAPRDAERLVRALIEGGRLEAAVRAAREALAGATAPDPGGDPDRRRMAAAAAAVLRDRLDRPRDALALWKQAVQVIQRGDVRAACAVAAAEIALDDLLDGRQAQALLAEAAPRLEGAAGDAAARLHRLLGDLHARRGDAKAAVAEYRRAARARNLARSAVQNTAWRGAHARSVEYFLAAGQLDRARDRLRQWLSEYPDAKMDGYYSLLLARYWAARRRWDHAVATVEMLLTVRPDSPYADRLLMLAAACHEQAGRPDRAAAAYRSLIADYPGSPLVPEARKRLAAGGPNAEGASP